MTKKELIELLKKKGFGQVSPVAFFDGTILFKVNDDLTINVGMATRNELYRKDIPLENITELHIDEILSLFTKVKTAGRQYQKLINNLRGE